MGRSRTVVCTFVFWLISNGLLLSIGHAENSVDDRLGTVGAVRFLETLKTYAPEGSIKCSTEKILGIIQPQAYADVKKLSEDNVGILRYHQKIADTNPCLIEKADHFWQELKELEDEKYSAARGSLSEEAGKGLFSEIKPGFVWEKALAAAGGDANLAAFFLSLCTTNQAGVTYHSPEAALKYRKSFEVNIEVLDAQLSKEISESEKEQLNNVKRVYVTRLGALSPTEKRLYCAHGMSFTSKVLGESVDISDRLKERISKSQERPISSIYAKNYHIHAGMMMGCALANCGVSSSIAGFVAQRLGAAYRSIRLCHDTRENLKMKEAIEKLIGTSYSAPEAAEKLQQWMKSGNSQKCLDAGSKKICDIVEILKTHPDDMVAIKSKRLVVEIDASILYRKWYLGGNSTAGINVPCTDYRVDGPKDLMQDDQKDGSLCGVPAWDAKRCLSARKKLNTWDVDFEWTASQHEVGARFGASQCKKGGDVSFTKNVCASNSLKKSDPNPGVR